jgi:hypothetical protein
MDQKICKEIHDFITIAIADECNPTWMFRRVQHIIILRKQSQAPPRESPQLPTAQLQTSPLQTAPPHITSQITNAYMQGFDASKIASIARVLSAIKKDDVMHTTDDTSCNSNVKAASTIDPYVNYPTCTRNAAECGRYDTDTQIQDCVCTNGSVYERAGRLHVHRVLHGNAFNSVPITSEFCPKQTKKRKECVNPDCKYNHCRYRYFIRKTGPKQTSRYGSLSKAARSLFPRMK